MTSNDLTGIAAVAGLSAWAAFAAYRTYKKVKSDGVQDDMAFRLIWLITSFAALYGANLFREQISRYSSPELLYSGLSGIIITIVIYSVFVLFFTVKRKLSELGPTKIWKKLLYSAVISTAAAWGATIVGITETITLVKLAIGGAVVFSIQLLS